jgi:uncharacterized protein YbjQ (UPF0145 family)
MLVTTTNSIEGRRIVAYHGIVSGETIYGANIFRDFFAGIRDIVGGRAGSYERLLRDGRDKAIEEMTNEARAKGANAVIGMDLDYGALGSNESRLMITAAGTAVTIE